MRWVTFSLALALVEASARDCSKATNADACVDLGCLARYYGSTGFECVLPVYARLDTAVPFDKAESDPSAPPHPIPEPVLSYGRYVPPSTLLAANHVCLYKREKDGWCYKRYANYEEMINDTETEVKYVEIIQELDEMTEVPKLRPITEEEYTEIVETQSGDFVTEAPPTCTSDAFDVVRKDTDDKLVITVALVWTFGALAIGVQVFMYYFYVARKKNKNQASSSSSAKMVNWISINPSTAYSGSRSFASDFLRSHFSI